MTRPSKTRATGLAAAATPLLALTALSLAVPPAAATFTPGTCGDNFGSYVEGISTNDGYCLLSWWCSDPSGCVARFHVEIHLDSTSAGSVRGSVFGTSAECTASSSGSGGSCGQDSNSVRLYGGGSLACEVNNGLFAGNGRIDCSVS
jgi:hypothetical protein